MRWNAGTAKAAKKLQNLGGRCTSVWAGTLKKQAFNTVSHPPQLPERDATEPHIWPNVYLADALLREPIRIIRAQPEQTVAWPKTLKCWCVVFTLILSPYGFERCHPVRFITGHGTIPMPTRWRTTSGIHRLHPVSGRRELPKRGWAFCAG
jgi:hypothetical protein